MQQLVIMTEGICTAIYKAFNLLICKILRKYRKEWGKT